MNLQKLTGTYLPSKESDQKYIVEEISLRHQLCLAPDAADNAIANELGSGKVSLEDDFDPTMVVSDENIHAEKSVQVSSDNIGKICASAGRVQLGSDHPSGKTLSDNVVRNDIEKQTKSGLITHALTEMEYCSREPKNLTNKVCETEAVKVSSSNIHMSKLAEASESLPSRKSDQASDINLTQPLM